MAWTTCIRSIPRAYQIYRLLSPSHRISLSREHLRVCILNKHLPKPQPSSRTWQALAHRLYSALIVPAKTLPLPFLDEWSILKDPECPRKTKQTSAFLERSSSAESTVPQSTDWRSGAGLGPRRPPWSLPPPSGYRGHFVCEHRSKETAMFVSVGASAVWPGPNKCGRFRCAPHPARRPTALWRLCKRPPFTSLPPPLSVLWQLLSDVFLE